jgi:AraC-like DNA-binding protein
MIKPAFKSVSLLESKPFKVIKQDNKQEFDFPWHYHPEFELTFISNSQGVRYVGNNIENFFDNDLVLLGSNLPHCWINTADQEQPSGAIVVYINQELIQWLTSGQFDAISRLFEKSSRGVKFSKDIALHVKSKFYRLLNTSPFEKYILLLKILNELSTTDEFELLSQNNFSYDLDYTNNERINVVYQFVRVNYQRKISLGEVAAHISMSEEYFSRFFSKSLMKPFFSFLNEYRISKACKLLIETDKQISQIYESVGFESIPFFYRQFKKIKNSSPQAYRLKYRDASK